ncbi:putative DNA-binding transcriptional regulator YafY [Mesoflavibacter sabulilitoris]|uniref:WYL domain-containing protein n=1 Tax=Mesoflavibacter zeaxanthinifaciens subsp. sabulilitoris TaxID=1520893 RepID=A0A2T1NAE2_9FLAO|nr:WYL domain-containing protein [Mesoflavibacter zeaxanthinifaciens]MBB3123776.1 putative DNA-binding transcriptional regulator YafY [Mesoflavibacter zeaxanthinifaciens subsp. sabulilitoris]PSG89106.1 WYL domain-containing protein [Mesoflavibacter zeaxanthinifaciens subsp. sabulilitoris]
MANSTHAHLRYNILDHCFRYKSYGFEELLKAVNEGIEELYPGESISERTLREDIKVFRDKKDGFGAPLPDGKRTYTYSDDDFTIAKRPLQKYEQYLLEAAQQLLSRFESHPKYNKLAEALIKFQDEEEQENDAKKILFYDHNEEYKGINHLKPLYLAIKKKQVLQVVYKGFKDKESSVFEFHPHILKQYNRRWFVFGYNKTKDIKAWSIPLDERLISFETLEDVNYLDSDKDWELFFRTMVGVTRINENIVRVVLRFYNGRENYFKTKPFQPDYEEFFEDDKQDQVWFETIINKELVQQLLSYGKDVEVLEPESLKKQMKEHSKAMQQFYE